MTGMTRLTVSWIGTDAAASIACVPVRIVTADVDLLVAPGESVRVRQGQLRVFVEAPGFLPQELSVATEDKENFPLVLNPRNLVAESGAAPAEYTPPTVAVDLAPWSRPRHGPAGAAELVFATFERGFEISRHAGDMLPIRLEIATRVTPRRRMAVPPLGESDTYRVSWQQRRTHVQRPRVEPTDPGGQLLMAYTTRQHETTWPPRRRVASNACAVRRRRLTRAAASYTQLLIGYAYTSSAATASGFGDGAAAREPQPPSGRTVWCLRRRRRGSPGMRSRR